MRWGNTIIFHLIEQDRTGEQGARGRIAREHVSSISVWDLIFWLPGLDSYQGPRTIRTAAGAGCRVEPADPSLAVEGDGESRFIHPIRAPVSDTTAASAALRGRASGCGVLFRATAVASMRTRARCSGRASFKKPGPDFAIAAAVGAKPDRATPEVRKHFARANPHSGLRGEAQVSGKDRRTGSWHRAGRQESAATPNSKQRAQCLWKRSTLYAFGPD